MAITRPDLTSRSMPSGAGPNPGEITPRPDPAAGLAPAKINGSAINGSAVKVTAHLSQPPDRVLPPAMRPGVDAAVPRSTILTPLRRPPGSLPPATALETLDRHLQRIPVIGVAAARNLVLHWGSAALLAGACAVSPMFVPARGVPTLLEYWDRSGQNLIFGLVAGAMFSGLEYVLPKAKETRAQWHQAFRVNDINAVVNQLWEGFTNLGPVKAADKVLAGKPGSVVKKGAATIASGVQAIALRGLLGGFGKFLISQLPQDVPVQRKIISFLESSPLRRAVGRSGSQSAAPTQKDPAVEKPATVENPLPNGSTLQDRIIDRIDSTLYYVGKGAPGTYGEVSATLVNWVANVGADVVSVLILTGGQADIPTTVGAVMIVNGFSAITNAGLQKNLSVAPSEPGWTYGEYYTRETALAIPRTVINRALCAGAGVSASMNFGIQFIVGALCLYMAGKWVTEYRNNSAALSANNLVGPE